MGLSSFNPLLPCSCPTRFDPLREDGGDGRHDIALVVLLPHSDGSVARFDGVHVGPACVPQPDFPLQKLYEEHCEIAGWGMTEYNNTSSYPDSVRAARYVSERSTTTYDNTDMLTTNCRKKICSIERLRN